MGLVLWLPMAKKSSKPHSASLKRPAPEKVSAALTPQPWWQQPQTAYSLVAVIAALLYLPTVFYGFTGLDDTHFLVLNQQYFGKFSNFFKGFVNSGILDYYRPLLLGSLIADAQIAGSSAGWYHFTNVLLHTGACLALLAVLRAIQLQPLTALLLTLLFAVHPLFVQAVAWVPGRNDPLVTLWVLLGFLQFLYFRKSTKLKHLFLHLLLFALALFSKEPGVLLPILCGLWWLLTDRKTLFTKSFYQLAVGWLAVFGSYWLLRQKALAIANVQGTRFSTMTTGLEALLANLRIVLESVGKLFTGSGLSVFAQFNDVVMYAGIAAAGVLLVCILLLKQAMNPKVVWGLAWFLGALLPTLVFIIQVPGNYDYLEHRVYMPAVGLVVVLGILLDALLAQRPSWRPTVAGVLVALLPIAAFASLKRSAAFETGETFWKSAVETSPGLARAHTGLGSYYYEKGKMEDALVHYEDAAKLVPANADKLNIVGTVYENQQQLSKARQAYGKARLYDGSKAAYLTNYARTYEKSGMLDSAQVLYLASAQQDSTLWETYFGLGVVSFQQQQYAAALANWKRVLQLNPKVKEVYTNLAVVFNTVGKPAEGARYLDQLALRGVAPEQVNPAIAQVLAPYRKTKAGTNKP